MNASLLKKVTLIFFLLLISHFVFSQDPYYITINKAKGLPSNSVYSMLQDSKGYIWFAHDEGLSRYDGYEFKTYYNSNQTSQSGSCVREDKLGRIWYENFDGFLYYVSNDTLRALRQNKPPGFIEFGLSDKKLYVAAIKTIDVFDIESLRLLKSINIPNNFLSATCFSQNEFYLCGKLYSRLTALDEPIILTNVLTDYKKMPMLMQRDGKGVFLVSKFNQSKICYEFRNDSLSKKFNLQELDFIQTTDYVDSCYWFFTTTGAYVYNQQGKILNNGKPYFKDKNIRGVIKDREGNYWFSTAGDGVLFVPNLEVEVLFKHINALRLFTFENNLLISTRNHKVLKADLKSNTIGELYNGNSNQEVYFLKYDSLSKNIFFTSNQFIVMDLEGKIKSKIYTAIKDVVRINHKYFAYASSGTFGLFSQQSNEINVWDSIHQANSNYEYINFSNWVDGLRAKSVYYNTQRNTIYFCTGTGLYKGTSRRVNEIIYDGKSIFSKKICGYKNLLFILQSDGRVLKLENEKLLEFTNKIIDPTQLFKSMWVHRNFMFLATPKNMYCINLDNNVVSEQYTYSEEISDVALFGDKLLFATQNGVMSQVLNHTAKKEVTARLCFNFMKVNNVLCDIGTQLNFNHNQNDIEINYSILSFKTNSQFALFYRINEGNWELTEDESRTLKLASLSAGDYKIDFVLGVPQDINPQQKSIAFSIQKPWWQTWWFFVSLAFLFLLVVFIIYVWRTNELIKKNKLITEKMEMENALSRSVLTAIKSQMNPHFFHNALNTIQSFIYTNDKKNASNFLTKFSKLTRMILEMSEKEKVNLQEEISSISLYLEIEKVRFNNNDFDFEMNVDNKLDRELIRIPSMIIQPYVENAIKHGLMHKLEKKQLVIDFKKEENDLIIKIDDNGIGRKRSGELNQIKKEKHQSFSTEANEKRLILLNKGNAKKVVVQYVDKQDEYNNSLGTTVIISIPII